jgi:serine/threonine protein kinase
MPGFEPMHDP